MILFGKENEGRPSGKSIEEHLKDLADKGRDA